MMLYALTLFFACGHGCGYPAQVTVSMRYASYEECNAAAKRWLAPNANPTNALSGYKCSGHKS